MAKLKTSIVFRPVGPSGSNGATALQSICLDGNIIWIIKNDLTGSNANKYARIYKYNIKTKKLKCMDKVFHNLGHANGCTFYNGGMFVTTYKGGVEGIRRVDVKTWKTKKVSNIHCTGIAYYGDGKFILQLGGDSYGLYKFDGSTFKKIKKFKLIGYGSYNTNQDIEYNGGIIYRIAITENKNRSAIILYKYKGGEGNIKPTKVFTTDGELESMTFYKGKPFIGKNMSSPGDALITTSSFKGVKG